MKFPPLEPVTSTKNCEFSSIEQRLKIIYENQEKIYAILTRLVDTDNFLRESAASKYRSNQTDL